MKLHDLLRYLALSAQHAAAGVDKKGADEFLKYYPEGTPDSIEFVINGQKRTLPRSVFEHHQVPGVRKARFRIDSDALPGADVSLEDEAGLGEEISSIEVPMKRSFFRRAAQIHISLELHQQDKPEGVHRVHEAYLSDPEPIPGKGDDQ